MDYTIRSWKTEDRSGIIISCNRIQYLLFADNTIRLEENEHKLQVVIATAYTKIIIPISADTRLNVTFTFTMRNINFIDFSGYAANRQINCKTKLLDKLGLNFTK